MLTADQVDERLQVAQYRPDKDATGGLRLVNGEVIVWAPYEFYTVDDAQVNAQIQVKLEATSQQLTDLKQILAAMLSATNAVFDANGWTRYVEIEEP